MKALLAAALGVALAAAGLPSLADIIVFNDGRVEEVPITNVTEQSVTVQSPYGDVEYPRSAVSWFCRSVAGKPGEEYYVTGLVMLRANNKTKARELFDRAIKADEQYQPLVDRAWEDYTRPPNKPAPEQKVRIVLTCPFCGGKGKVEVMRGTGGTTSGSSDSHVDIGSATVQADCPACSGRGYRVLEVGPDEGLCPTCSGAGCVKGSASNTSQQSATHTFGTETSSNTGGSATSNLGEAPYSPCGTCGGSGVLPVTRGGVRDAIAQALNPNAGGIGSPGSQGPSGAGGGEAVSENEESTKDNEKTSSDGGQSTFGKYRMYLLIGGSALIVVAVVATQLSKKKKQ